MQKVLTAEEMREVDRLTTERYGIPSIILMENAAHAVARVITEKLGGSAAGKKVLVLCGKGNNGGDGAALARILWILGMRVNVEVLGEVSETKGDAKINFEILEKLPKRDLGHRKDGIGLWQLNQEQISNWLNTTAFELYQYDVLVDAVFGTGLSRPLDKNSSFLSAVRGIKEYYMQNKPLLVSIDLPSGLNADLSTPIGEHFHADLTVTFTAPKLANVFPLASNSNGELIVANIGSPKELIDESPSKLFVSEKSDAESWLTTTKVKADSYKKTRGTALIIAGSEKYSGAAVLAANTCFASGCGMATVAVPKEIVNIVATKTSDEIIVKSFEDIEFNTNVVAIGCGLSNDEKTKEFIRQTVENRKTPMVLDAEALNALSPFDLQGNDEFPLILTPHLGEFTRLLGREVGEDKIAEVREFSQKHNVILVLKGERSLIAKPDGTVVINPTGNAGVSRAGAGDTLTGIITSFIAQTVELGWNKDKFEFDSSKMMGEVFNATVSAVYIAGLAGEVAAEKYSERLMTATDVRHCLQEAMEKVTSDE